MKTIVTGCGKSGTHWLAYVLGHFVPTEHEPVSYAHSPAEYVINCRLSTRPQIDAMLSAGHRVMHLVRDGRDVVRSRYSLRDPHMESFERSCTDWVDSVSACAGLPLLRLEDLIAPRAPSESYTLPAWQDWPTEYTDAFWRICGEQMAAHGYR